MSTVQFKFCEHCGAEIGAGAKTCPYCGAKAGPAPKPAVPRPKSATIAVLGSIVFPGIGQGYNGETTKAVGFFLIGLICAFSILLLVGVVAYPLFWAYSVYDAYRASKRIDSGLTTRRPRA
ncbi:MAG: zinc ribbon domain-containing protein [Nitrososphaerota archaeon]|nr:zinc ribbon domain-containing protein [Nitrososphaerota archaeon]MDG6966160.1 zinc ribbon domain-containing protein [Nitrososphaerota archaeon]MDG6977595.1 zinc ribbon domain-containing protein [Nitrososphaerota archaeon]MDG7020349.1 zinc ribbon domain-containing protein [Nitrososphaerota archaeon]MDG7022736.1 zinc ribbon domain-containing protein [Nitrososphaerota archaeon]